MNINNATEQLLEIKDKLDSLGIDFWLREGTLLAAMRGGFFNWDHDMDISVRAQDWRDFEMEGWKITPQKYMLGKITNYELRKTSDCRTDVMLQFHNPVLEVYLTLSPPYGGSMRTAIPDIFLDTPNYVEFLGTQFRVPLYPEMVLQSIYGDWKTPVKTGVGWRETWGEVRMGDYLKGGV